MNQKLFGRIPYRYIIIGFWSIVLAGLLALISSFIFVAKTKMPDTKELENPKFEESSIVYSEDMVEIDRYFRKNRQWVRYEDLSEHLVHALIATEDHRYFAHSGVDAYGTARAFAFLGTRGGASTITQQLAKQFFTANRSRNPLRRVWQKMKEWVIAVEFERRYTKEEIIAMFLNKFDFRYQAIGVVSAGNVYFGKDQRELTIPEAALLVGMLKNPYIYSPIENPDRAIQRRNTVLGQMYRNGYLGLEDYQRYRQEPVDVSAFAKGTNYNGLAPYFMAELKKYIKNLLEENRITKPGGETYDLDTDGLEIYTTIDTRYQRHAEAAMRKHMANQQKVFFNSWRNEDPWTYFESDVQNKDRQQLARNGQLNRLIEGTGLYRSLRKEYLTDVSARLADEIPDVRLWDGDIKRLLRAEQDRTYLNDLINRKYISKAQKEVYDQIMSSPTFEVLKSRWKEFKAEVKRQVNIKQPRELYSYSGPITQNLSVLDSIKYMSKFLQLGSVSIEPQTGYVRTWVGGTDYDIWKFDHVTSDRQIGSTFKPFLYTAALNNAISPCYKVRDMQYTIAAGDPIFQLSKTWEPSNSRDEFSDEEVTLKDGLKLSLNSLSVWLIKQLESVDPIIDVASSMGIKRSKIPPVPSIVLGSPEINVLELTTAYAAFANDGIATKPVFIKRIIHKGVSLYESQIQQDRAISSDVNTAMVELLKHASSSRHYALKTDFGGKTGTTNDHVDGWYVGITPNLVIGTWVGGDLPWIRYRDLSLGQGGQMARPFFIDYMQRIEGDSEIGFETDARFLFAAEPTIRTDCDAYESLYAPVDSLDTLGDEFQEEF
ncbi:MAG: transglycosylase domain-containing protein [Bacteroidota bacterium]